MQYLKISKYNPASRGINDRYISNNEWTSLSDIEKKKMTMSEYIETENKYVTFAKSILDRSKIRTLYVKDLEVNIPNTPVYIADGSLIFIESLYEKKDLSEDQIDWAIRCALRELIWCKLVGKNSFYIHFGYDYYMYIGGDFNLPSHRSIPEGIFFERLTSPYL